MILHTLGYWLNPSSLPLPPLLFSSPHGICPLLPASTSRPSSLDPRYHISDLCYRSPILASRLRYIAASSCSAAISVAFTLGRKFDFLATRNPRRDSVLRSSFVNTSGQGMKSCGTGMHDLCLINSKPPGIPLMRCCSSPDV